MSFGLGVGFYIFDCFYSADRDEFRDFLFFDDSFAEFRDTGLGLPRLFR